MTLPPSKIHCALIFGTRPEVIKLAAVAFALKAQPDIFTCTLISTGQHRELGRQALEMFDLKPDIDLDLMIDNQTVSAFFGKAIEKLDAVLAGLNPDWVFVQGDTGTVLAGALAAYYRKIRVAHVEAGLRTYDLMRPHPEEGNRQMVSRITSLHLAPTEHARQALLDEKIPDANILVTGNTVVDALQWIYKRYASEGDKLLTEVKGDNRRVVLTTIHRRESFGDQLIGMLEAIQTLAADEQLNLSFLIPVHPNPHVREAVHRILGKQKNVTLVAPLDYKVMLSVMARCWLVLTDSGGLQEEAPCFKVPVFVLRDTTERPEGIEAGVARLVTTHKTAIIEAVRGLATDAAQYQKMQAGRNPYGDGNAAALICDHLQKLPKDNHA